MNKIIDWFNDLFFGDETRLRKLIGKEIVDELNRLSRIEHARCDQYRIESERRIEMMNQTIATLHAQAHQMSDQVNRYEREIKALENIAQSIKEVGNGI